LRREDAELPLLRAGRLERARLQPVDASDEGRH